MTKKVYIAHPIAGDIQENLRKVSRVCRKAALEGVNPVAPYVAPLLTMSDEEESVDREIGIQMNCEILELCDEVWLTGPHVSPGMADEKQYAEMFKIPVIRRGDLLG